jgi:hypothetical protein
MSDHARLAFNGRHQLGRDSGPSGGGWSQGHLAGSANPRTMSSMPAGVDRTSILAVSDSTRKVCGLPPGA